MAKKNPKQAIRPGLVSGRMFKIERKKVFDKYHIYNWQKEFSI